MDSLLVLLKGVVLKHRDLYLEHSTHSWKVAQEEKHIFNYGAVDVIHLLKTLPSL